MTAEDRELGRFETELTAMKEQVGKMGVDIEQLKEDVHDIKLMLATLNTEVRVLTKRQSPGEVLYAFLMFGAAGAGRYTGTISEWLSVLLIVAGAIILQRGQLNKIVSGYLTRRQTGAYDARTD